LRSQYLFYDTTTTRCCQSPFFNIVSENANFGLLDIVGNGELLKALSMLKDIDILILTLKYRYGRTLEEIGAALKKDRSTIGKRHNKAIKVLREWILK